MKTIEEIENRKEKWTAIRKEKNVIYFEVEDLISKEKREEKKFEDAIPVIFELNGYNMIIGLGMLLSPLPWSFEWIGDNIYLEKKWK